jgi:DNA-binding transcriptional ArsR family regulator
MAARPATRRPAGRSFDVPSRPIVRDLSRDGASYQVEWDVRTAFDFIFSLYSEAGSTDDLPAADRTWLAENKAAVAAEIHGAAEALVNEEVAIHSGVLLLDHPEARTGADFVAVVAAAPPASVIRLIFQDHNFNPTVGALVDRALAGELDVLPLIAGQLPDLARTGRLELLRDPVAAHAEIVSVLRAWQPRFAEIEARVGGIIERDYEARAMDRERMNPADLVEATTGGIRYLAEPGIKRVILAPSYFSRPYNFLMSLGDTRFFGYPVGDAALDPGGDLTPPLSVVRLHRALGDETRLRILKLLSTRDLYLTEIAQLLELSKPTIKHHLAQLRSAGLVTITESGAVVYYTLRRARLDDASTEIKRFLME